MKPLFDKVAIIGVGLIGGSLGMALCSRGLVSRVVGVDTERISLELALEAEVIHEGSEDIACAVEDADLVVIATPVGLTVDIVKQIVPFIKEGCIVTDVGSTKASIVREVSKLMPPGTYFVGGHPMTGSETVGVKGADRYLFENAVYILTPAKETDRAAVLKTRELVDSLGAKVIELDPEEHDLMVAVVSHLPHLVATALVNTAGEIEQDHKGLLMLAAGGFRDTTRVASGNPVMWKDICLTNKEGILKVLDRFARVLEKTRQIIEMSDDKGLEEQFKKARELRRNIPSRMRGYLPQAYEIVVTVPDRPGVIALLTGCLGEQAININDIEILRVREGEGGTIRLAFSSEDDQVKAIETLRQNKINVKKR
ncbi:MAG: prephenate dehydrogenase/arogenate dehydrogenase family protein [Eubacteriales bacterium]